MSLLKKFLFYLLIYLNIVLIPLAYKQILYKYVQSNTYHLFDSYTPKGTGFFYTYKGKTVMVTNYHLCAGMSLVTVELPDRDYKVKPLALDGNNDLCLLDIPSPTYLSLHSFDYTWKNQPIFSVGYMNSHDAPVIEGNLIGPKQVTTNLFRIQTQRQTSFCKDIIGHRVMIDPFRKRTYCQISYNVIDTTLIIDGGQSGSPVLNYFGGVIGVVTSRSRRTGFSKFIPIEKVNKLIERSVK